MFRGALSEPVSAESVEAFALRFGLLSRRDGGVGAWLVKPRKSQGTYSEVAGPAGFHTDSQYHFDPERLFVLACVTPAEEGGDNLLIDVEDARAIALETLGEAGLNRLSQNVWRWSVPEVFQVDSVPAVSPPSPIFHPDGSIRWRIDNLVCETVADRDLAERFEAALQASSRFQTVRLLQGDVLLCDNRHALHARTDFDDMNRVLYRARLF